MRLTRLLVAGLVVLAMREAWAADPAVLAAETSVRLGLTAGYGHYEESVSPQDTEAGGLLGGAFNISVLRPVSSYPWGFSDVYAAAGYDFTGGFLHYRGNLQDAAETPYRAADNAGYNTAIVRLGAGRDLAGGGELIPYIAGGFQNWYRNVQGTNGVGEYYQAGLIGGGLKIDMVAGPMLVLSASAEGLAVFDGTVSAPSQEFKGDFGTSVEERVGLDADYRLSQAWHAYAGLGAVHYNYSGSKPGNAGSYEPLSSTVQVNSVIGIAYGF